MSKFDFKGQPIHFERYRFQLSSTDLHLIMNYLADYSHSRCTTVKGIDYRMKLKIIINHRTSLGEGVLPHTKLIKVCIFTQFPIHQD
ncbi:hypothetical protein HanRHA438_Chr03g0138131 [Helianthus annuus]|nr:hypothetical protein HanIR_Chr03g0138041 [Helianthus annuus]KAJ0937081.1 hypothetical protein HanRHA438_Chr03g0138131 [Helianthus annuus]